jgi:hypothetical protein
MKQEYTTYKEQYAPIESQMMRAASQAARQKGAIQEQIAKGGGTWADTEGAAARAKADVGIQGELQNQAEARRLMSMGVDPSSGRFGALTRKGAIDLAGETVRAMNLARQMEKTQGLQRAISAAGAINPSEYSTIGMGIRTQGADILKGAGALEQAKAGVQSQYLQTMGNLGTSYANMASGMAQNIANPLAEMAGYYSGLSGGNTSASSVGAINPMASYAAITKSPAVMQGKNELLGTTATKAKNDTAMELAKIRAQRDGTYGYDY